MSREEVAAGELARLDLLDRLEPAPRQAVLGWVSVIAIAFVFTIMCAGVPAAILGTMLGGGLKLGLVVLTIAFFVFSALFMNLLRADRTYFGTVLNKLDRDIAEGHVEHIDVIAEDAWVLRDETGVFAWLYLVDGSGPGYFFVEFGSLPDDGIRNHDPYRVPRRIALRRLPLSGVMLSQATELSDYADHTDALLVPDSFIRFDPLDLPRLRVAPLREYPRAIREAIHLAQGLGDETGLV